jgi:phosphoenolpyruvate carboxykinase (GTP)
VLKWIFERSEGTAKANMTPIGNIPTIDALDIRGLSLKPNALETLLDVDRDAWLEEVQSLKSYYDTIGPKMPQELITELEKLEARLKYQTE